jgi:hypothetical protein
MRTMYISLAWCAVLAPPLPNPQARPATRQSRLNSDWQPAAGMVRSCHSWRLMPLHNCTIFLQSVLLMRTTTSPSHAWLRRSQRHASPLMQGGSISTVGSADKPSYQVNLAGNHNSCHARVVVFVSLRYAFLC